MSEIKAAMAKYAQKIKNKIKINGKTKNHQ